MRIALRRKLEEVRVAREVELQNISAEKRFSIDNTYSFREYLACIQEPRKSY